MNKSSISQTISKTKDFKSSKKKLSVELGLCFPIWYDVVGYSTRSVDYLQIYQDTLAQLRGRINEFIDRDFVYFICTRDKVRFSKAQPYLGSDRIWHIPLEIGESRNKVEIGHIAPDVLRLESTPTLLTVHYQDSFETIHIHTLLRETKLNLGLTTTVHYTGYTSEPEIRPINGRHPHLAPLISIAKDTGQDVFIYYNTFDTQILALDDSIKFEFPWAVIPFCKTGILSAEHEAKFVEKCFINYFNSEYQWHNLQSEKTSLKNYISRLYRDANVIGTSVHYEVDDDSEYYLLGSSSVAPSAQHSFVVPTQIS